MAKEVLMPKFGMTQEEATIVRWIVQEGERVEKGDPLCEVTTDKVNMEVEAPADGVLAGIRYQEGDVVPVTQVIALILSQGEEVVPDSPAGAPGQAASGAQEDGEEAPGREEAVSATPLARRIARTEGVDLRLLSGSGPAGRVTKEDISAYLGNAGRPEHETAAPTEESGSDKVRATPSARRLAREHNVDLQAIPGSGREGRVQGSDVQAALATIKGIAEKAPGELEDVWERRLEPEIIPLSGMRQTIARRMTESYQQAPHIMLTCDIDMTRAAAMRSSFNARANAGKSQVSAIQTIAMTAVIVKACAAALEEFPILNSYFRDGKIILIPDVNIGVAVALEDGLIVPVVHRANRKSLYQIGEEVAARSKAAREGSLKPEDIADGTFTISNLGMFGIAHFTAILNPPQVAILAVGQIGRRFVPDEYDQPVLRSIMTVTLSVDHRVVDGAVGAKFLDTLRRILESAGSQWG